MEIIVPPLLKISRFTTLYRDESDCRSLGFHWSNSLGPLIVYIWSWVLAQVQVPVSYLMLLHLQIYQARLELVSSWSSDLVKLKGTSIVAFSLKLRVCLQLLDNTEHLTCCCLKASVALLLISANLIICLCRVDYQYVLVLSWFRCCHLFHSKN